jgi:hypothetical protein
MRQERLPTYDDGSLEPRKPLVACSALVAASAVALLAQLTTGYFDLRYFTPLVWSIEFLCLASLIQPLANRFGLTRSVRWSAVMAALCVISVQTSLRARRTPQLTEANRHPVEFSTLVNCLRSNSASEGNTVLFLKLPPYKFAALTGWRTAATPTNWARLSVKERYRFLEMFSIDYVVAADADSLRSIPGEPLSNCALPVARIRLPRAAPPVGVLREHRRFEATS